MGRMKRYILMLKLIYRGGVRESGLPKENSLF